MKNSNRTPVAVSAELLERRVLLSEVGTVTKIATNLSTTPLGQPIFISTLVESTTGARVTVGQLEIFDNGTPIFSEDLGVTRGKNAGYVYPEIFGEGGGVFYTGANVFTAVYLGHRGSFSTSTSKHVTDTVTAPTFRGKARNLRTATIVPGSGAAAVAGNTVAVAFNGYLTTGSIFNSSAIDNGLTPFSTNVPTTDTFTLGSNSILASFSQGIEGMQVGEIRVIDIPASLAYGNNPPPANSSGVQIPDNAELIFVVYLESLK